MLDSVDFTSQTRTIFAVYGQKLSKKVQTLVRPLWLGSGSFVLRNWVFLSSRTHPGLLSKLEEDKSSTPERVVSHRHKIREGLDAC